jgi:hypothetical protein
LFVSAVHLGILAHGEKKMCAIASPNDHFVRY